MPHITQSASSSTNLSCTTIQPAADGDRLVVSSLVDALSRLLTRGVNASGREGGPEGHQEAEDKNLTQVVPLMLQALQEAVRDQPKGARGTLQIDVCDGKIAISESHDGLEIADDVSKEYRTMPDMDFDTFMHALAQEIEHNPQPYCMKAVRLAGGINAHTLLGMPPELRRTITRRLNDVDIAALACVDRSFGEDLSVKARMMEFAGPTLLERRHREGLDMALVRINALPVLTHDRILDTVLFEVWQGPPS